ncbi:MAG: peroxiredoxin family protein [Solidesulfovibrio sp.]
MKQLFALFAAALLVTSMAGPALAIEASLAPAACPLPQGKGFPDVTLSGALTPSQTAYLGLPSDKLPAPISAIQTEALIVEVFSMYCPYCQKEAPTVNALFELIQLRGLSQRVKIIGIGAGNSDAEVEVFRKKYAVPFPLFSDASFAVHKRLGEVGTPFFYVLVKNADGSFKVLEANLGCMTSPQEFLAEVIQKAGL